MFSIPATLTLWYSLMALSMLWPHECFTCLFTLFRTYFPQNALWFLPSSSSGLHSNVTCSVRLFLATQSIIANFYSVYTYWHIHIPFIPFSCLFISLNTYHKYIAYFINLFSLSFESSTKIKGSDFTCSVL